MRPDTMILTIILATLWFAEVAALNTAHLSLGAQPGTMVVTWSSEQSLHQSDVQLQTENKRRAYKNTADCYVEFGGGPASLASRYTHSFILLRNHAI